MDHKKKRVKIKKFFGAGPLFLVRCLLADPLHIEQYDHIEEEGNEDEDDAAEDPNCEGCHPGRVGWGGREGRVEHVHQHLASNSRIL